MNREEQIGMVHEKINKGLNFNVFVSNPFNSGFSGWAHEADAFVNIEQTTRFDHNSWLEKGDWDQDPMGINSNKFRCDEFINNHKGKHILFSGCSVTYGVGLYTKELWSYKLYEKIKNDEEVSGYFNLGTPGTSTIDICANVMKYIKHHGKPDAIFLDLPDLGRFYMIEEEIFNNDKKRNIDDLTKNINKMIRHATYSGELNYLAETMKIYAYQSLFFLEQFCKEAKIKLYIFSYVMDTIRFLQNTDLESIINIDNDTIVDELFEYSQKNKTDKFFLLARDGVHHGTAFHDVWANKMYNMYKFGKLDV
jgi:hypothetical protein